VILYARFAEINDLNRSLPGCGDLVALGRHARMAMPTEVRLSSTERN
jgi:hypothetical protein